MHSKTKAYYIRLDVFPYGHQPGYPDGQRHRHQDMKIKAYPRRGMEDTRIHPSIYSAKGIAIPEYHTGSKYSNKICITERVTQIRLCTIYIIIMQRMRRS